MRIYKVLAFSLLIAMSASALVLGGDPSQGSDAAKPEAKHDHESATKADTMMDRHKAMIEMHEKMQSEMQAMDADLNRLLVEMNGATGDKKVEAMAAIINHLVQQHKTMHQRMAAMQMRMMQGMTKPNSDSSGSEKSTASTEEKHAHQH